MTQKTPSQETKNYINNSHPITASRFAPSKTVHQLFACTLTGLAVISSVSAQSRYAITDLGTLPGTTTSIVRGLNDRGDVVGSCSGGTSPNEVACVWRNGVLSSLGKLAGGNYSDANAINLLGVVVGDGDTGNWRPQSWVTSPNGLINIFPNNGGNTHTVGINNSGAICGYYTKSLSGNIASWRGAIWTVDPKDPRKYRMTDLPALPGNDPKFTSAIPFAFNQSGQAAGWAVNDIIGQQASFWNNDDAHSIVQLGAFPGDWSSIAWGMNDLGQVVGESHPPFGSRPVVWDNDVAHTPYELPLLPDDNTFQSTNTGIEMPIPTAGGDENENEVSPGGNTFTYTYSVLSSNTASLIVNFGYYGFGGDKNEYDLIYTDGPSGTFVRRIYRLGSLYSTDNGAFSPFAPVPGQPGGTNNPPPVNTSQPPGNPAGLTYTLLGGNV